MIHRIIRLTIVAATAIVLFASCRSNSNSMSYFDDIVESASGSLPPQGDALKIMPDDQLYISVLSTNPRAAIPYNLPQGFSSPRDPVTGQMLNESSFSLPRYTVNSDGDIAFPELGKLHVAGMTTAQVAEMITKKVSDAMADPIVTVELANFHVSVLGEVAKPGVVAATGNHFSILDAIARTGDMTPYAVRDKVLVIRQNPDGSKSYHRINLRDSKAFESPYFYLQQNDMVIVTPNETRRSNASFDTNNSYRIQVTSAIISGCSVIASLVIALAVK